MKYPELLYNVVLIEPEIPQNTGNIGRTCVGAHSILHLVGPIGFEISDRQLKRAGLDYWPHLELRQYENWDQWWSQVEDPSRVFFSPPNRKNHSIRPTCSRGIGWSLAVRPRASGKKLLKSFPLKPIAFPCEGPFVASIWPLRSPWSSMRASGK